MNSQNQPKMSKAERTAAAREKAREIRAAELKRQKRNGWLIRGGVVAAAIAVIAVIALVVVTTMRNNAPIADSGPVPANVNAYGGIVFGANNAVIPPSTNDSTVDKNTLPAAPTASPTAVIDPEQIGIKATPVGQPVQVVVYLDFICEFCKAFEQTNASVLKQFQDAGQITLEYRPAGLLDGASTTNYSSRASNVAACVADQAPDKYLDFVAALYQNQPAEGGTGLSNDQLKQYAKDAGANVDSCVDNATYRPMIQYVTGQAQAHGITSTPTIFVDGQSYRSQAQGFTDFQAYVQGVIDAKK
ncbi:MAG: DsbA family protein [Renibacterium salmoninarum]|nr:DsbA family protein [Renibacterium salmoninarum]